MLNATVSAVHVSIYLQGVHSVFKNQIPGLSRTTFTIFYLFIQGLLHYTGPKQIL